MLKHFTSKFVILSMMTLSIALASDTDIRDPITDFLSDVNVRFKAALDDDKYDIVSQHFTISEVRGFGKDKAGDLNDPDAVTYRVSQPNTESNYEFRSDLVNPLAVAICAGRSDLVKDWITYVPDVNAIDLWVRGYRQPANLAYIAVNFTKPMCIDGARDWQRTQIVRLLGEQGADFNARHGAQMVGIYDNTALTAINLDGSHEQDIHIAVAGMALLYGADPKIAGSSRILAVVNETPDHPKGSFGDVAVKYCERALDLMLSGCQPMRLAPSVRAKLVKLRAQRITALKSLDLGE